MPSTQVLIPFLPPSGLSISHSSFPPSDIHRLLTFYNSSTSLSPTCFDGPQDFFYKARALILKSGSSTHMSFFIVFKTSRLYARHSQARQLRLSVASHGAGLPHNDVLPYGEQASGRLLVIFPALDPYPSRHNFLLNPHTPYLQARHSQIRITTTLFFRYQVSGGKRHSAASPSTSSSLSSSLKSGSRSHRSSRSAAVHCTEICTSAVG